MRPALHLLAFLACFAAFAASASSPLKVFMLNPEHLERVRAEAGDPGSIFAAELLLRYHTFERIRTQIEPDGAQPEELARSKSWNYCVENIKYFFRLARMARHVGIDLYAVRPEGSGDLKSGIDFLLPYTTKENNWPYEQITAWQPERFALTLQVARAVFNDPAMHEAARHMGWEQPGLEAFINMPSRLPEARGHP